MKYSALKGSWSLHLWRSGSLHGLGGKLLAGSFQVLFFRPIKMLVTVMLT